MRRDLYEEYDYIDCYLYESNHFSEIFEECIDDITQNINEYSLMKYTGWCYNNKTYSINNKNIGKKIYIWYIYENINEWGYVLRYDKDNIYIVVNEKKNVTINDIKSTLQHEFVHMIKLYSSDSQNNLNTKKEQVSKIKESILTEFNIKKYMPIVKNHMYVMKKVTNILYICGNNEQLASINTAIKYINSLSYNDVKLMVQSQYEQEQNDTTALFHGPNSFSKQAQIYNILKEIDKTHFLTMFTNVIDTFYTYYPILQLLIAYYLNKHTLVKLKYITYDYIMNQFQNKGLIPFTDNITNEIDKVYNYLVSIYNKYKKDLYNATYVIMDKKHLFLTPEDVVNISEHIEYKHYYKIYLLD